LATFKIIKHNETYSVIDEMMDNLVVSTTYLHPNKKTRGHSHKETDEVYIFKSGTGIMVIDKEQINVGKFDIVKINSGAFHQVTNTGKTVLCFICIFSKYGGRN
jgi:mannose-6-phosphate isomerase-like protein (cupin superfamily)